ncbi:MAG: metallophosphoesterase family protein [Bacteroidota bacterium]
MRIAIMSDIHSNLPALEAVLQRIETLGADALHCLGDIVGYGPFPEECIGLVGARCDVVVRGNHDSGLLGETSVEDFNSMGRLALEWTRDRVSAASLTYLRGLPLVCRREEVTFVHSSPASPERWPYVFSLTDAEEAFRAFTTRLCFVGHTHVPVVVGEDLSVNSFGPPGRTEDRARFLVNVGSVGQPRDGDPRAAFGLLDIEAWTYETVRVEYDIPKTQAAIRKAGLPAPLARRLSRGV